MRYTPCWKQIGITKDRYLELLHFCRQYPSWKADANSLLLSKPVRIDGIPHGNKTGKPVEFAAEKREKLLAKMAIVEECAKSISNGEWYAAIMQHICYNVNFEQIDVSLIPASNRNAFFKQRRLFFDLLNMKKDT